MPAPAAPSVQLGPDLTADALGYGAMSIAGTYGNIGEAESLRLLEDVRERGVTFIDTANLYGNGLSEQILGTFLAGRREEFTIATKVGIVPGGGVGKRTARGDAAYIKEQIDLSLQRLGTDYVDLYYLHRVDPNVPVEESAGALGELVQAGKVRTIGLSEATAEEIRRAHAVHPLAAVQSEWSVFARDVERYVLPTLAELGIGFVAYSPVGRGLLTDRFSPDQIGEGDTRLAFPWFTAENLPHNDALAGRLREQAARLGVPAAALSLAWLYAKAGSLGVALSTIPGTRYTDHFDELLTGLTAELDAEASSVLDGLAAEVRGDRSFDPCWVSGGREGLIGAA